MEFKEDINGGLATVTIELFNVYDFESGLYRYTDEPPGAVGSGPLIDYGVTIALFIGYRRPIRARARRPAPWPRCSRA